MLAQLTHLNSEMNSEAAGAEAGTHPDPGTGMELLTQGEACLFLW